jgi:hypothetical protein
MNDLNYGGEKKVYDYAIDKTKQMHKIVNHEQVKKGKVFPELK